MWPHKGLDWWAIVLALIALITAYPIEVVAHITAPKWKNWWAERSGASMRERIEKLEKRLADDEQNFSLLSEAEDMMLKGVEATGQLVVLCLQFLVIFFLLSVARFTPLEVSFKDVVPFLILPVLASALGYMIAFAVLGKITAFRMRRSPSNRDRSRKSIDKLKRRLESRTAK